MIELLVIDIVQVEIKNQISKSGAYFGFRILMSWVAVDEVGAHVKDWMIKEPINDLNYNFKCEFQSLGFWPL